MYFNNLLHFITNIWHRHLQLTIVRLVNKISISDLQTLLRPSSGARDYDVDYHIGRFVLGLLYVAD